MADLPPYMAPPYETFWIALTYKMIIAYIPADHNRENSENLPMISAYFTKTLPGGSSRECCADLIF